MTSEEILQIKKLLEGNYPKLKESDDAVFVMMLGEYKFQVMIEAAKNFIKTSKFPPTIANLIEEYGKVVLRNKTEIVNQMNRSGLFKSTREYERALTFVERDLIPTWFQVMFTNFVKSQIGTSSRLMIEATT